MNLVFYNVYGDIECSSESNVVEVLFDSDNNLLMFSIWNQKKDEIQRRSIKLDDHFHNFKVII